jgi:hypothetical protein
VPGVFDTGVGEDHQGLADGSPDPHYVLLINPDGNALDPAIVEDSSVPPISDGAWVADTGTSKWIGPKFNTGASAGEAVDAGAGAGVYVYRTTIDLTGYDLNSFVLTGAWATDNAGLDIKVNDGVAANPSTGLANTVQYGALTPFTIQGGPGGNATFVNGVNTVDFYVRNTGALPGFTGLRVQGLRGLGNPTTVTGAGTLEILPFVAGGPVNLVFQGGAANTAYRLERSTNLGSWTLVTTQTSNAGGAINFQDTAPPAGRAYYRITK